MLVLSATLPTIIQLYRVTDHQTGGRYRTRATSPLHALVTLFAAGVKRYLDASSSTPRLGLNSSAIAHSLVTVLFGYLVAKVQGSPTALNRLAFQAIIRAFLDGTATNELCS